MSETMRIVHIGAGPFSRANHCPCLQRLSQGDAPRVSLEAICDLDIEKARAFQQDFGYKRVYTDFGAMIDEVQPDAVYSMVAPQFTAGVLERVLPYGLPTFTEKPPGVTIPQAERLAELAERHGNVTYVAFNRRRVPGLERMKAWMGEHAPIRYLRAEMIRCNRTEPEFAIGTGIHALDCLRFLCGNVVELETMPAEYPGRNYRDYLVRVRFDTGILADLAILVCAGLSRERYLAQADDAMMETTVGAGYTSPFCTLGERAYADNKVLFDDPVEEDRLKAGGFLGEHLAFLDAARTGVQPDCRLQDARHSLRLGVAVFEGFSGQLDDFVPSAKDPYVKG